MYVEGFESLYGLLGDKEDADACMNEKAPEKKRIWRVGGVPHLPNTHSLLVYGFTRHC